MYVACITIEIREPRGGDENGQVPPRKAKPPTVIEIREPRGGDENNLIKKMAVYYRLIEIREPRGGDENAKVGLTPHF